MTSPLEQKKRRARGLAVVTANRLSDGVVVYRTLDDDWTTSLAAAAVVPAAEAAALLTRANADGIRAVGAYVAPVERAAGAEHTPGNLREQIRAHGPTFALPGTV